MNRHITALNRLIIDIQASWRLMAIDMLEVPIFLLELPILLLLTIQKYQAQAQLELMQEIVMLDRAIAAMIGGDR